MASGPPGPRPWASSLPSTEISVWSGPNRRESRCQPGVRARRWTCSPLGDSTARLSSDQPRMIRITVRPAGPRKAASTMHSLPATIAPSSKKASSSRPAASGSSRLWTSDGPFGGQAETPLLAEMRLGDRLRLPGDRPSRRVERFEAVGQHPRLAGALDDRLHAGPGQRDLAGLPAHAEPDRVPRQLTEGARRAERPPRPGRGTAGRWKAYPRPSPHGG